MGVNFLQSMSKGVKSAGKWVNHSAGSVGHSVKSSGKWIGHKADDALSSVGKAGNKLVDFAEQQTEQLTSFLTSPTTLIIVGVVVVGGVLILSRR